MVDFRFGLKEKRYILAGATTLGGLALLTWTEEIANFFLKWNVQAMPSLLSVKTLVAVILFWGTYALVKNRI